MKQINVSELIELLSKFSKESMVEVEGCDCIGRACGAEERDGIVLITRMY